MNVFIKIIETRVNRKSAKALTFTGFICLTFSILTFIFYLKDGSNNLVYLFPVLLIAGIALIILSLAYYTEI